MGKIKDQTEEDKRLADKILLEEKEVTGYSFDAINHIHTLDGKPLNGITTVLGVIAKPFLISWAVAMAVESIKAEIYDKALVPPREMLDGIFERAKNAHRRKKEEAGNVGTLVHKTIENLLKGLIERQEGVFKGDETSESKQIQNFIDWAVRNKVKFLESEKHLYSRKYWIGGIADFVCEIEGEIFVGDVKTSSAIYPENYLQMSAYALMLEEMGRKDITGTIVVNLKKDGAIETKKSYDMVGNKKAFLATLELYRALEILK